MLQKHLTRLLIISVWCHLVWTVKCSLLHFVQGKIWGVSCLCCLLGRPRNLCEAGLQRRKWQHIAELSWRNTTENTLWMFPVDGIILNIVLEYIHRTIRMHTYLKLSNAWRWAFLVAQMVKNPPAVQETWVQSLGWEDLLEEGMATPFSILAWRIPMVKGA